MLGTLGAATADQIERKVLYIAVGFTSRHKESGYVIGTAESKAEADNAVLKQLEIGSITHGKVIKATSVKQLQD